MSNESKAPDYAVIARDMMRENFKPSWMSEDDWCQIEEETLRTAGLSYKAMGEQIAVGVANGYSVETQRQELTTIWKA